MSDKTLRDRLGQLPENIRELVEKVDGPSFAAGGVIGVAAGATVNLIVKKLSSNGAFDPVADFVDYVKAYGNGVEVVAADVIEVPIDDDSDAIEVEAEVISEGETEA